MRNQEPRAEDYRWGSDWNGIQVGLWTAQLSVESGQPVELRAAVRNVSSDSIEVQPNFTLMVRWGEEKFEYRDGPRPAEPWLLCPGEFLEILGWRFQEPWESDVTTSKFWVVYGSEEVEQLSSDVVTIRLR